MTSGSGSGSSTGAGAGEATGDGCAGFGELEPEAVGSFGLKQGVNSLFQMGLRILISTLQRRHIHRRGTGVGAADGPGLFSPLLLDFLFAILVFTV